MDMHILILGDVILVLFASVEGVEWLVDSTLVSYAESKSLGCKRVVFGMDKIENEKERTGVTVFATTSYICCGRFKQN